MHAIWIDLTGYISREPTREHTPFMEAAAEGHEIIVQTFLHHVSVIEIHNKIHQLFLYFYYAKHNLQ